MDIKTTKLELMHLLLQTEKISVLEKLRKVFEDEQTDWWNDMSPEERDEIREGLLQADEGDLTANEEVMKVFDKWNSK